MHSSDRPTFAGIITGLAEYYDRPISQAIIELYWQSLELFDVKAVSAAASLHLRDAEKGQFMPKVADLTRLIEGTVSDQAQLAWSKLHTAISRIGPYQTVAFDDPIIHTVAEDMGGWTHLCDMLTEDAPFRAQEFCKRYRAYAARRSAIPHLPMLTGIIEADCRMRGFEEFIPPPMIVGDAAKARGVIQSGNKDLKAVAYQRLEQPITAALAQRAQE